MQNPDRISVLDHIPKSEWGAIRDGTSRYDCTDALRGAIAAVKGTGRTLVFPAGTYLVSTVRFNGDNYAVDTGAARFKQRKSAGGAAPPVIQIVSASHVTIGYLHVMGNIAEGTGEDSHAVVLSQCKNVSIDGIFAADIRGDALYCYARNTSDAERQSGCYVRFVSGSNLFRNILTVVGGQLHVGAVINMGPVGYRDFDVEPNNATGTYEPVDLQIDFARVGSCEITSDDPQVINSSVRIGALDADLGRVKPSVPPYPKAPGAGAYAIGISRVRNTKIGHLRARDYNSYPISLGVDWSIVEIDTLDIANCSRTDTTYNTMILQQGDAGNGRLRIGSLICDAANTKYLARVHQTGILNIDVAKIERMKCLVGVQISGRFANGAIDINGSSGIALVNSRNVTFENVMMKNAGSATGFSGCTGIRTINSKLGFGRIRKEG